MHRSNKTLVLLLNALFGGVGAVYLATGSLVITVVAASLAAMAMVLMSPHG